MDQKRFVLCSATALFALAVACSKSPETPVAPSSSAEVTAGAVPSDGSTLKVTAPVPVSPINNAQPDGSIVLVATKAQGKFTSVSPSVRIRSQEQRRRGRLLARDRWRWLGPR